MKARLGPAVRARAYLVATDSQLHYGCDMHHARQTLRDRGYRLTPQRNLIWEVLRDAGRHMTAEEVTAEVRSTLPDVNVSTVYRTLELLVSLDLVVETRLEGSACYYEVSPEPTHHHFVCRKCGAVGHFGDELLAPVHEELNAPRLQHRPDPGDGLRAVRGVPGRRDRRPGRAPESGVSGEPARDCSRRSGEDFR